LAKRSELAQRPGKEKLIGMSAPMSLGAQSI
jgi:hypothetical protein